VNESEGGRLESGRVRHARDRPGPIEAVVFFDHPSGWNRIHRAMVWKAEYVDASDIAADDAPQPRPDTGQSRVSTAPPAGPARPPHRPVALARARSVPAGDRAQGRSVRGAKLPGVVALCSSTPGCVVTTPFTSGCVVPLATTMSGLPSPLTSAIAIAPASGAG
jgi:hypothetical protein